MTEDLDWPDPLLYPTNRNKKTALDALLNVCGDASFLLAITGFTSLSFLVTKLTDKDLPFIGFPNIEIIFGDEFPYVYNKKYERSETPLSREVKEIWLERGFSIINAPGAISLLAAIEKGRVKFFYLHRLHGKVYITDHHHMLGSSNFSTMGFTGRPECNRVYDKASFTADYENFNRIFQNYRSEAMDFNVQVSDLLKELAKFTNWQEALARAIAEVIEVRNFERDREIQAIFAKLWPSQQSGIKLALNKIKEYGGVLIADPTGSGKTRLVTTLIKILIKMRLQKGVSEHIVICPKVCFVKWKEEVETIVSRNNCILTHGKVSRKNQGQKIFPVAILALDEIHGFTNERSNRTSYIKNLSPEILVASSSTPIKRNVQEIYKYLSMFDLDNLSDEEFDNLKVYRKKRQKSPEETGVLKGILSRFIVRRTKAEINRIVNKNPSAYINRKGNLCRYPKQITRTYKTKETPDDIDTMRKINALCEELRGLACLNLDYDPSEPISEEGFLNQRKALARGLAIYHVRSTIRSSKAALAEHILGTAEACKAFSLQDAEKSPSGNVIKKISLMTGIETNLSKDILADWIVDPKAFQAAAIAEMQIYQEIWRLVRDHMSDRRELGKIEKLISLAASGDLVVAFDSKPITVSFLKNMHKEFHSKSGVKLIHYHGAMGEKVRDKFVSTFDLESKAIGVVGISTDALSEAVDLQAASKLVLLDIPGVLTKLEQRIGRIDRLDSDHEKIEIYWPEENLDFSWDGDQRILTTIDNVRDLLGGNVYKPGFSEDDEVVDFSLILSMKSADLSKKMKDDSLDDVVESDIDSVKSLVYGEKPLISEKIYYRFSDVKAPVRNRIAAFHDEDPWFFCCFAETDRRPCLWVLHDPLANFKHGFTTDKVKICQFFRKKLHGRENVELTEDAFNGFCKDFSSVIHLVLTNRQRRALKVARKYLTYRIQEADSTRHELYRSLLDQITPDFSDFQILNIDWTWLADQWADELSKWKKNLLSRKLGVLENFDSLKEFFPSIDLSESFLKRMQGRLAEEFESEDQPVKNRIVSCIIAFPSQVGDKQKNLEFFKNRPWKNSPVPPPLVGP